MSVVLRPMAAADIESVLAIEAASSPDPWTVGIVTDELNGPNRRYVVAVDHAGDHADDHEGEVVGFCGVLAQVGEGHVTNIAVTPRHRAQRIAARLLLDNLRWALTQEVSALTLEVRVGNEPAMRLYRRFGFAPVGTRPRYYPNNDDALILWVHEVNGAEFHHRLAGIELWLATPRDDTHVPVREMP
jgi:[ribosomal protein S18]-alanine N-acetyltransferase